MSRAAPSRREHPDAFLWPDDNAGPSLGASLDDSVPWPLREFERRAEVLAAPHQLDRPWVLAAGERVVKAYDLRHFDAIDRARALAEAEIAAAMGSVAGVVPTWRVGEVGGWLAIEMTRMDASLEQHLAAVQEGKEVPLPAERWGRLLAQVATTLETLHRRGIVHRDVKPANLLFDGSREHLLVADFSIALATRRRRLTRRRTEGEAGTLGTDRFIAPEQFDGQVGPLVDQYALGITAADALGELADREGVRLALLRGTAREPSERYRSIDELGTALRAALDEHAPHRLSRRLERVAPRWRATWGPAAAAAVATWAFVTVSRPPRLAWSAGLVLPLLGFLATCLALRAMAFLRADRTQPRLRIADRAWFPLLAFALALAVFLPVIRTSPGKAASHVVGCAIGALALSAYLGALSPDAGMGTVRLVRRWERWRGGRRWSGRAVLVCAAAAVAAVPGATARIWPGSVPLPGRAAAYGPLRLVAAFRDASLAGDEARACALVRVVASADRVACPRWLPLARRWLTAELGSARADRLSQRRLDDVRVSFDPDTKFVGLPYYTLRTRHGDEILGTMGPEDAARKVWMVELSHMPATGPALSGPQWRYETVRRGGRWAISSVEICDSRTRVGPDCVQLTQMRVEDFARRSADGPPRP